MDIRIPTVVDCDDLLEAVTDQLDHDKFFEFVKKLDLIVADWNFTDRLIAYFDKEKQKQLSQLNGLPEDGDADYYDDHATGR